MSTSCTGLIEAVFVPLGAPNAVIRTAIMRACVVLSVCVSLCVTDKRQEYKQNADVDGFVFQLSHFPP